jgi:uncharacterized protein (TIGR02646 family)
MIRVRIDPATFSQAQHEFFDDWLVRAEAARSAVIDDVREGRDHQFRSEIWQSLKRFLLEQFFKWKCAYCEADMEATEYGDAEHFRPKAALTTHEAGKLVKAQHPGYYWLAYDYRNLLPACKRCNSADGKMNQFPIEATQHFCPESDLSGLPNPDDLDELEIPLLLNPYKDDPHRFIRFAEHGIVTVVKDEKGNESPRGRESVRVYNLTRSGLDKKRRKAQRDAWRDYLDAWKTDSVPAVLSRIQSEEFSAAALDYIELKLAEVKPELLRVPA